ncbi:hypothetical protein R1flu_003604 [Riccia fluitans]|uniref:Uncharacterized protein n=1 Tax=Riccia fluitans TaxID=41844 RepID=A0ABD1Y9G2_9MARC
MAKTITTERGDIRGTPSWNRLGGALANSVVEEGATVPGRSSQTVQTVLDRAQLPALEYQYPYRPIPSRHSQILAATSVTPLAVLTSESSKRDSRLLI